MPSRVFFLRCMLIHVLNLYEKIRPRNFTLNMYMLTSLSDTFRKLGHCPMTSRNCSSIKNHDFEWKEHIGYGQILVN